MNSTLLKFALQQPAQYLLNQLVGQDPTLVQTIFNAAPYKTLALHCTSSPEIYQVVQFTETSIRLISLPVGPADLTISGTRAALLNLVSNPEPATALYHPELQVSGDLQLLQKIHHQLSRLEVDWIDLIENPVLHAGAAALRSTGALAAKQMNSLLLNTTDYLQEEAALLPARTEVRQLEERLLNLRQRIDRLQAGIQHVSHTHVTNRRTPLV